MVKIRGKKIRKLRATDKLYKEQLKFAEGWTKHHPLMENPLDGEEAKKKEVFDLIEHRPLSVIGAYYHMLRKLYFIKVDGGTWYELPEENLRRR